MIEHMNIIVAIENHASMVLNLLNVKITVI